MVAVVLGCTEVTVFVQAPDAAVPDAPGAQDTETMDTSSDTAVENDDGPLWVDTGKPVLVDTGTAGDVAAEAPKSAEQTRCESGAPRLSWVGTSCIDRNAPPSSIATPCTFRAVPSGGMRCLPSLAIDGHIRGVLGTSCSGGVFNALLDYTTWPENLAGSYFGGGTTWSASRLRTVPKPGPFTWADLASCKASSVGYPYANAAGQTLVGGDPLDDKLFVAAL